MKRFRMKVLNHSCLKKDVTDSARLAYVDKEGSMRQIYAEVRQIGTGELEDGSIVAYTDVRFVYRLTNGK